MLLLVLRTTDLTNGLWQALIRLLRVPRAWSIGSLFEQLRLLRSSSLTPFDIRLGLVNAGMRAGCMFLLKMLRSLVIEALKLVRLVLSPASMTIWGRPVPWYLLYRVRVVLLRLLVVEIMKTVVLVV